MTSRRPLRNALRIGIDVGGTFTDLAAIDRDGTVCRRKVFSTPDDPSRAVLEGLDIFLSDLGMEASMPAEIVHGSTVATNAVLERKGARTAFIATAGFRDLLAIARQDRPDLFDLESRRPPPLVPAELSFELAERVAYDGEVLETLDEAAVAPLVDGLRDLEVESVAVCFLLSFVRPEHERRVGEALREAGLHVSLSSEVLPEFREYERASTTAMNAYVAPILDRYLTRLEEKLPAGKLRIMLSNGGSAGVGVARREAVRCVLSGPAAGVVGALRVARQAGTDRVIGFDMGGTSTDVALLDGAIPATSEGAVAGLSVRVPIVDIHTVGSGGGSIARVDTGGALRVGPHSAGADPGPVCYGRGGLQPTVTDANLVLGRLPADRFLGGTYELDEVAARRELARLGKAAGIGTGAGVDPTRRDEAEMALHAALGVVRVANARMERALRAISVERGHDPWDFSLVSFGGAGGLHACDLARALGIGRVLVPPSASVLSAFGMLAADVVKDYVQTVMRGGDTSFEELEASARGLEARGREDLAAEGVSEDRMRLRPGLDLRYEGQAFEIAVPLAENFLELFHSEHDRLYGHSDPEAPVEIVNLRLRANSRVEVPELRPLEDHAEESTPVELERRSVVVGRLEALRGDEPGRLDVRDAPVFEHESLRPGHRLPGPAVVVSEDTTVWLGPGERAVVDGYRNLLIDVGRPAGEGAAP
ncbi:MAG: hydantoinase/oxoprolinase family protein [Gemmatimonadales bacterium]